MTKLQSYKSPDFLLEHIKKTMSFYDPVCVDPDGGFFHHFRDDGSIYDKNTRHLVSSARFVYNYAMAAIEFDSSYYLKLVEHGLDYLNENHRNLPTGGYLWIVTEDDCLDDTNHAYGLAFVLLAHAVSLKAGISSSRQFIEQIWEHLETYFWEENYGLYKDELSITLKPISDYRGQNSNMHLCEAMLMCFEATGENKYLLRANTLAESMLSLSEQSGGFIWEHFNQDWTINWNYNKDNPKHLFRPWGFQPGHQIEWAKLLLQLNRYIPSQKNIDVAISLFERSLDIAWDNDNSGVVYGFSPRLTVCDSDKYFWVQAEAIATAALLAIETGEEKYWAWYQKIWEYVWEYFIDHEHGAWYRILDKTNKKYDDLKSPAGKTDYHTMGACYEVLRLLRAKETNLPIANCGERK
ncbi:AGE family epimerase/isomerase [Aliikangiella coralliicola]|uniref:AGE family epimerase/isomerase n=1 Tax=Aliikangiella coralliicola TaxID=2592383 RepID=A0A545U8X9_9GAMM|nr:AGE family epimerase/isomerase [Aliikangiella coralliicola]TQV85924.1 AGE family epimerase/isomerase [Aliikangiella coralliicola]